MCFRLPATGGAPWTLTQDSFAAVRAQRTWKAVAYEWRQGPAAKEYINIHDTTWVSGSCVRAHPTHRPELHVITKPIITLLLHIFTLLLPVIT